MNRIALILTMIIICGLAASCGSDARPIVSGAPYLPPVIVFESEAPSASPGSVPKGETAPELLYDEYYINAEYNPADRTLIGIQRVVYRNMTDTEQSTVYFNCYLNAFGADSETKPWFDNFTAKVYADGEDYGSLTVKNALAGGEAVPYIMNGTALSVSLKTPLAPKDRLEIELTIEALVPAIKHRTGANDKAAWFGNFFPVLAVYDGGRFRLDPYYRAGDPFCSNTANYNVQITTPPGYTVAGTGDCVVTEDGGKKKSSFTARMVRDFCFALSSEYMASTITTETGIAVTLYHWSDIENADSILKTAADALRYFSQNVGPYPYASLNIAESELFRAGGMEYPAMVLIDSAHLQSQNIHETVAHMVGHQWFYNIIGSNQIDSAWMDEGLTSFVRRAVLHTERETELAFEDEYAALSAQLGSMHLKTPEHSLDEYLSWNEYHSLSYTRPKLMFYALDKLMGRETFITFLQKYYERCSFKTATKEDLISCAEEVYGQSLTVFFDSWLSGESLPPL